MQGLPKTYDTTGVLGVTTSTLDAEGEILERRPVDVTPAQVREAASRFVGEIDQVPPAVSAIKVDGERAYKRAARGETVVMEPRRVTVYSFDVMRVAPDAFDARVVCSAGTYIRTLVADVGDVLGCGAHVAHLRRTAIGDMTAREATKVDALSLDAVRRTEDVLAHMQRVDVDQATAVLARNGRTFEASAADGEVLVVGPNGAVGVFEATNGTLRPITVIGAPSEQSGDVN